MSAPWIGSTRKSTLNGEVAGRTASRKSKRSSGTHLQGIKYLRSLHIHTRIPPTHLSRMRAACCHSSLMVSFLSWSDIRNSFFSIVMATRERREESLCSQAGGGGVETEVEAGAEVLWARNGTISSNWLDLLFIFMALSSLVIIRWWWWKWWWWRSSPLTPDPVSSRLGVPRTLMIGRKRLLPPQQPPHFPPPPSPSLWRFP